MARLPNFDIVLNRVDLPEIQTGHAIQYLIRCGWYEFQWSFGHSGLTRIWSRICTLGVDNGVV